MTIKKKRKIINDEIEKKCPGSKIRSNGMGRGLGTGKGNGPVGRFRNVK